MTKPHDGPTGVEQARLSESDRGDADWREWGPYVAERGWGSVREDYSADGEAWGSFPFEHAVSRTYRWNEDGLAAWSDAGQHVCIGLALWNGADPILKERPFGLASRQGNHGEDVKDYWWYVDNTPTHSWMTTRYAYPTREFPYADLVEANRGRDRSQPEYELNDTGIFAGDEYVMVTTDWAKAGPRDLCMRISLHNRGPEPVTVHALPTVWFRNTWSWGSTGGNRPRLEADGSTIRGRHDRVGDFTVVSSGPAQRDMLFCENETNVGRLYGTSTFAGEAATAYPKDGINDHVVHGAATVNPDREGTKAAFHHVLTIEPGGTEEVRVRLTCETTPGDLIDEFADVLATRAQEADAFWAAAFGDLDEERAHVSRQAMAGLLASKQFYAYDVRRWLEGDAGQPPPPAARWHGRNATWQHLVSENLILMPDPWEYPWFAAWDLAFHAVALAPVDPEFAKQQLLLLLDEWYQHPNGQIPAYEWKFSDANPPVHAWAVHQVFLIDGARDIGFLKRAAHKLLLNFTWWVNRKDAEGNNLFEGGFLGLDNIGPFDRSAPMPGGGVLEQSDGTAWMAMFCLDMLNISLALAEHDDSYDDVATKFLQHFCAIAAAANDLGLWDAEDGFYYDLIRRPGGSRQRVPVRSLVGLIPILAVARIDSATLEKHPHVARRLAWLQDHRPEYDEAIHFDEMNNRDLLAVCHVERLVRVLEKMLDPAEFLSPYGIRSLSAYHHEHPVTVDLGGESFTVGYEPAEGETPLFGGNSNWRGPIWFPINALVVSTLRRYGAHLGDEFRVEYPTHSGDKVPLDAIADDLVERMMSLFLVDETGQRPCQAGLTWQEDVLFNEYFHGDTGLGLGATHQTGWTALVATLTLGWPR